MATYIVATHFTTHITTQIIIEGGPRNSWDLPLNKKLHLVYNELENNFYESQKIKEWRVFLRQQ